VPILQQPQTALKNLILGSWDLHHQCTLGLEDPQSDITVWLVGPGLRRDVTHCHLMACGAPFTICIGFEHDESAMAKGTAGSTLRFHENSTGKQQLLGEIALRFASSLQVGSQTLCFFQATAYRNYCLPRRYIWSRSFRDALRRRSARDGDVPITPHESHAMAVFYICPRPVVLVTVAQGQTGNMFPMNVMGNVGNGYFAFGLNSSRSAAALVESARKVVLSSIPFEQAAFASSLRGNHRKPSIDWAELPFATRILDGLEAPVPAFALRIREMYIEAVHKLGSHTLFVAKITRDERLACGPEFFVAHGLYHAWLQRNGFDHVEAD
jgi:flavin reductase (DIM6/NTAB) family NADH-FMN oxidoreductase RutF